jgi:glycosyltransferase involved in cell wall biosynthesis
VRVLHVGCGFRPWRRGGLVAYIEDLMCEQVRRGDEAAYFFSGRMYPRNRGPSLRRWVRDDIPMYELVNSPLYDHGRQPALEVSEPRVERLLAEAIDEFRPDVMHLQELAGLPSSILDVARRMGVPTVVTLQDYFFVCPNFKLLDSNGRVCSRSDVGASCIATTSADPRPAGALFDATVSYDLEHAPALRRMEPARRDPHIRRAAAAVGRRAAPTSGPQGTPQDYERRRQLNVARLNGADRVIAMSERVADIHVALGVDPAHVRTVHLTLAHIETLTPRVAAPGGVVTFGTLGAFESVPKGGRLLLDAVRLLSDSAAAGRFRLVVHGWIAPRFAEAAAALDAIELRAPFAPSELDAMLDEIDVGLMPSIWEEAYGYAGMEFLAKAIPVVANAIGGMTDYVRPRQTGWLNGSRTAEELAGIMAGIVERPHEVLELNAALRASHDELVKPMADHADEMEAVYADVVAARSHAPSVRAS